jgi:hypothetical protein
VDVEWLIALTEALPKWWLLGLRRHHTDPRVRHIASRLVLAPTDMRARGWLLELLIDGSVLRVPPAEDGRIVEERELRGDGPSMSTRQPGRRIAREPTPGPILL